MPRPSPRQSRALASLALALLILVAGSPFGPSALGATAPDPDRWYGSTRYDTAAAIALAAFPDGAATVYLATGLSFPDALAGSAAAGKAKAPVLLTAPDALPAATASALGSLKPGRIVILGGTGAVSDAVASAAAAYAPTVVREGAADRYATAAAIALAAFPAGAATVYLATGQNFPDALSGGALAAALGAPVLLTAPDALPAATAAALASLKPAHAVILGGTGAVSDAVAAALAGLVPDVHRIAGSDRYATSAAIAALYPSAATVYVATGLNFPDALAGAPLGGPLLLVPGTYVPDAILAQVQRLHPSRVVALGSSGVVSPWVMVELRTAAGL